MLLLNQQKLLLQLLLLGASLPLAAKPMNILLFTADDLGYELMDPVMKPKLDLTPNLDRFSRQGVSFRHGYVNVSICQPSRAVMGTGRYPHNSGAMGFIHVEKSVPTVMDTLGKNGYMTGVLGKVGHSTPVMSYQWDYHKDFVDLGAGRDPEKYHNYCGEFLKQSKEAGKPFFLMVNSHDPHRPFHNPEKPVKVAAAPSKLFTPEQVKVPGYLTDSKETRLELSWYYNSVRRLDDTFGRVMDALDKAGLANSTVVMFITDNGSAVPFAKANCYLASSRTPWFVRWPGVTEPATIDDDHFISTIDLFPTFMEAADEPAPDGLDGQSILPLLKGMQQDGRDHVFTQIDYKIGGPATPMRCIQDENHIYIFNPWSKPGANYRNNNEGLCMKGMSRVGKTDPSSQARVMMFRERVLEEYYDLKNDPDCLKNLMRDPEMAARIKAMQGRLRKWMKNTHDPALPIFDARGDSGKLSAAMAKFPSKKSLMSQEQIEEIKRKSISKKNRKARRNKKKTKP